MSAVLDASVALTWCFADQATPATDLLLDEVRDLGAVVPPLWFLEVGNVLLQAERRGRITALELALRHALPLFTRDGDLAKAAGRRGVVTK